MTNWLVPPGSQKPGIGQQFAEKAATKIATDQVAKLGLGAAGTAIGGPLGGAAGSALGELAGPLAGQLAGSLFMKGGPVYLQGGGGLAPGWDQASLLQLLSENIHALAPQEGKSTQEVIQDFLRSRGAIADVKQGPNTRSAHITPVQEATPEAPAEHVSDEGPSKEEVAAAALAAKKKAEADALAAKPKYDAPRSKSSAQWNIPLGSGFLGADWSTSGSYSDMDRGEDPWSAGIKGTWSFNKGGDVPSNSIWDSVKKAASYAWKNDNKPGDRWAEKNKKPQYKAIGGMTPGPLGMSDMMVAGKDKSISKVKLKKAKGDMSEEMEYSYHPPLAAKPTGE